MAREREDDEKEKRTFFWANREPAPTYGSLETRRKIAAALASQKKAFPKNIGEGLTYFGESIGEAGLMWKLEQQERARAAMLAQQGADLTGGDPAVPQRQSSATQIEDPLVTAALTPPDQPAPQTEPPPVAPPEQPPPPPPPPAVAPPTFAPRFNAAFGNPRDPATLGSPATRSSLVFNPQQAQGGIETGGPPQADLAGSTIYSPQQAAAAAGPLGSPAPEPPLGPPMPPMELPLAAVNPAVDPRAPNPMPGQMAMPRPRPNIPQSDIQQVAAQMPPGLSPEQGGFNQLDAAADAPRPGDPGVTPGRFANVRYNNPGAQYPGQDARTFGTTGTGTIGGGHKIANFPSPVHGAASNFALLERGYTGMPIGAAIYKWSGNNRSTVPGYDPKTVITPEMARDPAFAVPFMKAVSGGEAPGRYPMSDDQWQMAHNWYRSGGLPPGVDTGGTQLAGRNPREAATVALMQQSQGPPSPREMQSEALMQEVIGGRGGQRGFPATASLGRTGVANDAPPPGSPMGSLPGINDAVQQRQRIYDAVQQQQQQAPPTAPEVPQPDPTMAGGSTPLPTTTSTSPISRSTSPAGSEPPTATDIRPMPVGAPGDVVAQVGAAAPIVPPAPQQAQPVAPYEMKRPVEPTPPKRAEMGDLERRAWRMKIANPGDPDVANMVNPVIAVEQKKRDDNFARDVEAYKSKMDIFKQETQTYETFQRERDQRAATLAKSYEEARTAQEANRDRARFGMEPKDFFTGMEKEKQAALKQANVLTQANIAKKLLDEGIISGWGANFRLNAAKLSAWMLNNKVEGDLATNTERVINAMKSQMSVALENLQGGDSRVSEGDVKVVQGQVAADPTLQLETMKRILAENERIARVRLGQYEGKRDKYLTGHAADDMFDVPTPQTAPKEYVSRLMANRDSETARAAFDRRFGEGAADLEIARSRRMERRQKRN